MTKMWRKWRWSTATALLVAVLISGCALWTAPASENEQAVLAAGDLGALTCAGVVAYGSDKDQATARLAVDAARELLSEDSTTIDALTAVLQEGMPEKREAALIATLLQRLRARLGAGGVIDPDTTAAAMAGGFIEACAGILGQTT